MTGLTRTCVLTAAAGLWLCSAALAEDYEIRLHRPLKAGDHYQMAALARDSRKASTTMDGQAFRQSAEDLTLEFEAMVKVLEVTKEACSKIALTIIKCCKVDGEVRTPLLPKDATVTAAFLNGKYIFEQGGVPVVPEVQKALHLLVLLGKRGLADDETYGTSDRKKVGEHWGINAERALDDLKKSGLEAKKEDFIGTVKLEKVAKVGGGECLQIAADMSIARLSKEVPGGFAIDKGNIQARMVSILPVNPALGPVEETSNFAMTVVIRGKPKPDSPEIVVEVIVQSHVETKYTYPK